MPVELRHSPSLSRREVLRLLGLAGLSAGASLGWLGGCVRERLPSLELWHIWTGRQRELMRDALQRFNRLHASLVVTEVSLRTRGLHDKIEAAHRAQALPDLLVLESSRRAELDRLGCLEDLSPWAARDQLALPEMLMSQDLERCRLGERLPILPLASAYGMGVFFRNLRVLASLGLDKAEPPRRFSELTELSRDVVHRANEGERLGLIAMDPCGGVGLMPFVLFSHGHRAPILSPDGTRSLIGEEPCLSVAEQLESYVQTVYGRHGGWRALLQWRHEFSGSVSVPQSDPFTQGWQAFAINGAWMTGFYQEAMGPAAFDSQPIPGIDGLHGAVAAHAWSIGMNPASPRKAEAWALMRFLVFERDGGARFCLEQGRPSPVRLFNEHVDYSLKYPSWPGVAATLQLDKPFAHGVNDAALRSLLAEVPLRRVAGETTAEIYRDIGRRHQRLLDERAAPGKSLS